jgi:hypothetical protein
MEKKKKRKKKKEKKKQLKLHPPLREREQPWWKLCLAFQ